MANVIVADDEALLRWAISERLTREGHVVMEAGTGARALDVVADIAEPAVVILDVKLPDMNGLTVLSLIRRRRPDIPVVMITAYWASDALDEAKRLGAQAFLAKPVNLDRVAAVVAAAQDGHGRPATRA